MQESTINTLILWKKKSVVFGFVFFPRIINIFFSFCWRTHWNKYTLFKECITLLMKRCFCLNVRFFSRLSGLHFKTFYHVEMYLLFFVARFFLSFKKCPIVFFYVFSPFWIYSWLNCPASVENWRRRCLNSSAAERKTLTAFEVTSEIFPRHHLQWLSFFRLT